MLNLKNKKVTILGAQRSGLAVADVVIKRGGIPRISEIKNKEKVPDELCQQMAEKGIGTEFGGHSLSLIKDSDMVVLSPGVRIDSEPVAVAKKNNIPVLGEIEFAFQFCRKPIIAITGSNGKTTVSTLTHKVLEQAGLHSCLCGNVGVPFSQFIGNSSDVDYFVLEISSFQMESLISQEESKKFGLVRFEPYIAVLLNFSQNHLDRHKDMEEYFQAKTNIFLNQGNKDYAVLNSTMFGIEKVTASIKSRISFFDQGTERKYSQNQLAVVSVAKILGIKPQSYDKVFSEFKGVEHRLEHVCCIDDVEFINDSKATTVESGRWALEHIDKPIIMICGGRDKNLDFHPLRDLVSKKVKSMIVIGEAREKLTGVFKDVVSVKASDSFEQAIIHAKELATKGDCVLLSPMCASFDMFDNYEHRGKVFKAIVKNMNQYA